MKDLILIGDSRYVQMAAEIMGFEYSTVTQYHGTGSNIRSTSPKEFDGYSIQITSQVSASGYTYKEGTDIYISMHNHLKNASPGTIVLLWLGINDYAAIDSTFDFYNSLAKIYPSLNFYV